jgi:hypothetical protein
MVYRTQNYWLLGHFPSSGDLGNRDTTFRKLDLFPSQVKWGRKHLDQVQWLRLDLSKGPTWVGVLSFYNMIIDVFYRLVSTVALFVIKMLLILQTFSASAYTYIWNFMGFFCLMGVRFWLLLRTVFVNFGRYTFLWNVDLTFSSFFFTYSSCVHMFDKCHLLPWIFIYFFFGTVWVGGGLVFEPHYRSQFSNL